MNDTVPWRGAREKHPKFFQILIESLTKEEDIVLDWQTNTGTTLRNYHYIFATYLLFSLIL